MIDWIDLGPNVTAQQVDAFRSFWEASKPDPERERLLRLVELAQARGDIAAVAILRGRLKP